MAHTEGPYSVQYVGRFSTGTLAYAVLKDGKPTDAVLEIWGGPETGWGFTGWYVDAEVTESGQQNYSTAKVAIAYGLSALVAEIG